MGLGFGGGCLRRRFGFVARVGGCLGGFVVGVLDRDLFCQIEQFLQVLGPQGVDTHLEVVHLGLAADDD